MLVCVTKLQCNYATKRTELWQNPLSTLKVSWHNYSLNTMKVKLHKSLHVI